MWHAETHMRERPRCDITWQTPLRNGDIQVIHEEDDLSQPNPAYPSPDPRESHPQRYYLGMYNEGYFVPMIQVLYAFDVACSLIGFDRIEKGGGQPDNPLCGLFRKEQIDQRPLFQRGYTSVSLPQEAFIQHTEGITTREWYRGYHAGITDKNLALYGLVDTGRKHPCSVEPIEQVKWLL